MTRDEMIEKLERVEQFCTYQINDAAARLDKRGNSEAVKACLDAHAVLVALRAPAVHDCEAWRNEGLGCAVCNKRAPAVTGEAERRINTRCPSCGSSTLFVAEGGHLTCSLIGCEEPVVERAIARLRGAIRQDAGTGVDSWSPPAAGAPPALVALVQKLQAAYPLVGKTRTDAGFERYEAALTDVLRWSPAPAPAAGVVHSCSRNTSAVRSCDQAQGRPENDDEDDPAGPGSPRPSIASPAPAPVAPPAQPLREMQHAPRPDCDAEGWHLCAPPAVAGGDAPEIQVGDWVTFLDDFIGPWLVYGIDDDTVFLKGTGSVHRDRVSEVRGERHGQPFIWRRRQEGQ